MNINIAVDNDEIIANLHGQLILFHNEIYGTNFKKEDYFTYDFHKIWGIVENEGRKRVAEFIESNYFKEIIPTEGAQKAMKFLKEKGHTLFVVTGRNRSLAEETENWIKKYFPNIFSGICFANTYGNDGLRIRKSVLCRKLNAKLIIEDDLLHVTDCTNAGIQTIVYDYPWNGGVLPENATRVFDWHQVINCVGEFSSKALY